MAERIIQGAQRLDYTSDAMGFKTDITKGYGHYPAHEHKGSVTEMPVYEDDDSALFLEHVIDMENNAACFWLMWYNNSGIPLFGSAILNEQGVQKVIHYAKRIHTHKFLAP